MPLRSLAEDAALALPAGSFDVRGWDVITRVDDEKIGEVDDVLTDDEGELRYLDVDLGLFQKHVLLPLGHARVDEAADVVWVPGMTKDRFQHIPEYTHDLGSITSEYEARLGEAYAGAYADEQYYARPEHSTERPRMTGTTGIGDRRLASLDELEGFDVARGDPDPRGWDVLSSDGRTVGAVSELIIDTSALKVRYLDCDLDEDALGLEDRDRHILIPTGYARLDEERERVTVDAISSSNIQALPPFIGLPLEEEYEEHLHTGFTSSPRGGRSYEHPRYSTEPSYGPRDETLASEAGEARLTRSEEELDVGKREVPRGEVEIRKRVETERVERPVTRQHEEVEIERHPVSGMRAEEARIEGEEVHVPLTEEELVVEKRPEVKEELVVRKRAVEEEEEVEADLRRERLDVERHGDIEEEEGRGQER